MNDTEERSACVRENEILTDVYRCKVKAEFYFPPYEICFYPYDWVSGFPLQVCRIQVKRDRMDIEAHLKQAHKTTLKLYTNNFERGQVWSTKFLKVFSGCD